MKQLKYLVSMFALVALASCQQDELDSVSVAENATELNLQNFSYDGIKSLVEGNEASHSIRLIDGDVVKEISCLRKIEGFELYDEENTATFYEGANEDSISVIVGDDYASIKFNYKGDELGYVTSTDQAMVANALAAYEGVETRSGGASAVTRSASNSNSFKMNITQLVKGSDKESKCTIAEVTDEEKADLNEEPEPYATTRTAYYTQWPRGNTLTIHLVRDQSNMPNEWEVNWQVNDMINSIRDTRPDINVKVWRSNTGYRRASFNGQQELDRFIDYCRSSSFPWKEAVDHDIIFLIGWGEYSDCAGRAYQNTYKLSRYNNSWAFGVSATYAASPKNLAHEVGHILGAGHVSGRPWWQFFLNDDLMTGTYSTKRSGYHLDLNNWNTVRNNLY